VKPVTNIVAARMTIALRDVRILWNPFMFDVAQTFRSAGRRPKGLRYKSAVITSAIAIWPHATTEDVATA
jgi:hypothetical protein